jgi:preprotein translocase subunit SecD
MATAQTRFVWAFSAFGALCGCGMHRQPGPSHSLIEFRLAQQTPAPGFTVMQAAAGSDSDFYVADSVVMSDTDLVDVQVHRTARGLLLVLHPTHGGASRLNRVTSRNVGKRLAVILGGRLAVAAPIADTSAVPPKLGIDVAADLPDSAAARIAAALAARWPGR